MSTFIIAPAAFVKLQKWTLRILYAICLLFLVLVASICVFYLLSSYQYLTLWYQQLDCCLYHKEDWSLDFFNSKTRTVGIFIGVTAIAISFCGIIFLLSTGFRRKLVRLIEHREIRISSVAILSFFLVFIAAWCFSIWGNGLVRPAVDEQFSAMYASGSHPFVAWSYYMLPNNHVLFNVLNSLFFFVEDKVASGRIISQICYAFTGWIMLWWMQALLKNYFLSTLATLILLLQLHTWGFGFQARGYALYELAEWAALASIWRYYTSTEPWSLILFFLACVVGFCTIPSFLYWYTGLMLLAMIVMMYQRKIDFRFVSIQCAVFVTTLLFYSPALLFSGWSAIAENKYVTVGRQVGFFSEFTEVLKYYPYAIVSTIVPFKQWLSYTLTAIPLFLFFSKLKEKRQVGLIVVALVFSFIGMVFLMKRYPFPRNLNGHLSVLLAGILTILLPTIDVILKTVIRKLKCHHKYAWAILFLPVAMLVFTMLRANNKEIDFELYGTYTNGPFEERQKFLQTLPKEATLALEGAFLYYYPARTLGINVKKCSSGLEDYLIIPRDQNNARPKFYHPMMINGEYELLKRD